MNGASGLGLVADIFEECILGLDFLKEHGCSMDLKNQTLNLGEESIILCSRRALLKNKGGFLICSKSTVVSPQCETIVWTTDGNCCSEGIAVAEGDEACDNIPGVIVGKTLVNFSNERVPIRIANLTDKAINIKKGCRMATWSHAVSLRSLRRETTNVKQDGLPMSLLELADRSKQHLSQPQQESLLNLINVYRDVFACSPSEIGRTSAAHHHIDTGDAIPIKQAPRRIPLAKRNEVTEMVQDMRKQDIIEPSSSSWVSPVVLVKKKHGSTRVCADYRRVNNATIKDSYPLPRIDDTFDAMAGASWFSTLDLRSGYWQVEMKPSDREKTAFTTGDGLWQFKVMPFGLCNAPATFERLMDKVLQGLPLNVCLVYLDDILVHGKTFEAALHHLSDVFERLRKANQK